MTGLADEARGGTMVEVAYDERKFTELVLYVATDLVQRQSRRS